jgi:hypothetical protein
MVLRKKIKLDATDLEPALRIKDPLNYQEVLIKKKISEFLGLKVLKL